MKSAPRPQSFVDSLQPKKRPKGSRSSSRANIPLHRLGLPRRKSHVRTMNSVKIVEEFWERVWEARNPAAIDDFVIEDFVITTGCVDVVSRTKFKEWAAAFMAKIDDLQFEVIETFQNEDGSRVASRWRIAGKNNGILGTPADQQTISLTGTAVWAVREDGKLRHIELLQQLRASRSDRSTAGDL